MGTWGRRRYLAVRHMTTNKDPRLHAEYWCTTISGSVSRSHFGVQETYRQPVTIPFVLHCLWKEIGSERSGISGVFQQAWIRSSREQMGNRVLHARNQSDTGVSLVWVKMRNSHYSSCRALYSALRLTNFITLFALAAVLPFIALIQWQLAY
jgi:hypothetical protein